jgi:hypothetical protein
MHQRMCNEYLIGTQTAVPSNQQQSSIDSSTLEVQESRQHHKEYWSSQRIAVLSSKMKSSVDSHVLEYGKSRQCHKDSTYREHSLMSDKPIRWAEALSVMDEEQGMGDVPASWQAVHSRSHKGAFRGRQIDVTSFQV